VLSLLGEAENNMNMVRNVLAFLALSCISLSAQQITGNIRGTVRDPSGAVVRGAAVTARQAETGLLRGTNVLADDSGHTRVET
ncbi:MAG: carboxypeptidase-like regulatory domain-containing protein, partial [Terracidiphilus sp.]